MAECNLRREVKKILGKRHSNNGVEYLVLLKGQRRGKEQWIKYKELLYAKHLLKEYNESQRCRHQQKHMSGSSSMQREVTTRDRSPLPDSSAESNSVLGNSDKTTLLQKKVDNVSSNRMLKYSKKKCKTKKGVQELNGDSVQYKISTRLPMNRRVSGDQKQPSKEVFQNNCISISSCTGTCDSGKEKDSVMECEKNIDDSVSSLSLSDMSDSDEILYSLADPEQEDDESEKSSMATSDSEDILYSLADPSEPSSAESVDDKSEIKSESLHSNAEDSGSHLHLSILGTLRQAADSELRFKRSPSEGLAHNHLTDLSESGKPGSEQSSSALSAISNVDKSRKGHAAKPSSQTLPQPSCGTSHREPSPSLASTNNLPQIPHVVSTLPSNSSLPNYDAFRRTFGKHHLSQRPSGRKQRDGDSDAESVPRRISVRNSESTFKYKQIMVKKHQHYTQIWLTSQTKCKNALNPKVFQELITALRNAENDDTRVVLLTGSGHVFCSGIDLHYLMSGDIRQAAVQMAESLKEFMRALMVFPKPIVAAVNGSAVGLGVSLLPLCDVIYASDKASFYCPYTKLGHTPEGGASYTFTQTMGIVKANELLLEGRKITAQEASQIGLVSQVFWPTSMMQEVIPRVQQMAQMSAESLEATKFLIRGNLHTKLEMTINTECDMLGYLWASAQCQNAMAAFMNENEDLIF